MRNLLILFSKLILLVLLLSGCRENGLINTPSIDNQSNEIPMVTSDLMSDSDFNFSSFTNQFISLQITDTHSSPYEGVYAKFLDNDTNLIKSGISDSTGLIYVNLLLPSSTAKVGVTFLAIGMLQDTLWLELNKSHSINLEDLHSSGTLINKALKFNKILKVPSPSDSDGDGISDNNDDFPNDHDRASEVFYPSEDSWGTLAFEDYYPTNGDYDFNDVVVNYQISEILDGNGNVKEINAKFIAVATGAEFRNGFALYFPSIEGNIESKIIGRAVQKNEKKWTLVSNGLIAHIFPDMHSGFNGQSFINTQDGADELKGDTTVLKLILKSPEKLERAPYNAFIYRTSNPSLEIHMADFEPTPLFNNNYFNTKDDNSNQDIGKTFRNFNNLPWAINVQDTWSHPKERIDILDAYPNFRGWVNSNGKNNRNWISSKKKWDKVWKYNLK